MPAEKFFGWCDLCHQSVECLDRPIDPEEAQCVADHFITVDHKDSAGNSCDGSGKSPDGMIDGDDAESWPDDDPFALLNDEPPDYDGDDGWPPEPGDYENKAPEGKFRVMLCDLVPMMASRRETKPDYYYRGDFDSLDEAKKHCDKPERGTSCVVFDDAGATVHESSGMWPITIMI